MAKRKKTNTDNSAVVLEEQDNNKQDQDVNKLFIFYPDGEEDPENKKKTAYSINDASLVMHCGFENDKLNRVEGELTTSYYFDDTNLGLMRTWRYRFYNVQIVDIILDSSTDMIKYHIMADGFDVNIE